MEKRKQKKIVLKKVEREFSAGGIVYKKDNDEISWLVTESSPSEKYPKSIYRFPKGWIDDENDGVTPGPLSSGEKKLTEEKLRNAAKREVKEEGGVEAKIVKKIGTERFFYTRDGKRILKFVTFYLMEWVKDVKEGPGFETQRVEWLSYQDAKEKLTHSGEKKFLDKAKQVLDSGVQVNLV